MRLSYLTGYQFCNEHRSKAGRLHRQALNLSLGLTNHVSLVSQITAINVASTTPVISPGDVIQ